MKCNVPATWVLRWNRNHMLFLVPIILFLLRGSMPALNPFSKAPVIMADTLISLEGKVLNSETNEPVQAQLRFFRQPYGGNVGISKVKNQQGDYRLTLMKSYKYTITLTADGYLTKNEVIHLNNIDEMGRMLKDFYLVPTGVGQILRLQSLIFEQSKTKITPESFDELNQLVEIMKKNPSMMIQLEGHTDYKGRASLNMELSQSRVEAVKDYLVDKGVKSKKIKLKAFGGSKPISREMEDEKRRINRRVEVRILNI